MITLIEKTVVSGLMAGLHTADVYAERPKTPPEAYWLIEKTSASEENHVKMARMAVQSISAASLLEAATMSHDAEAVMAALPAAEPDVSRVRLNSAYNFTDPDTKEYRYQAVFDVYYMEGDN